LVAVHWDAVEYGKVQYERLIVLTSGTIAARND
jgi:hypothetical protein